MFIPFKCSSFFLHICTKLCTYYVDLIAMMRTNLRFVSLSVFNRIFLGMFREFLVVFTPDSTSDQFFYPYLPVTFLIEQFVSSVPDNTTDIYFNSSNPIDHLDNYNKPNDNYIDN